MRLLGLFWAAVLLVLGGGIGVVAWLGPPAPPPEAALQAPGPAPAEAPVPPVPAPAGAAPPAAVPAVSVPAVSAPPVSVPGGPSAAAPAAAPPAPLAAPEPPPLRLAETRPAGPDPVIAPPDDALLEPSRHGLVPRLGPEARTSIRTYARPFDREDRRPRVGLIINNIGLFAQHSEEAIRRLPGGVTLAFSPYALRQGPLLDRARARGMEMLIALPLEPQGFGAQADPGERALLTSLTVGENLDRLEWALSRIRGQVGAIGGLGGMRGERFAANAELLGIIQASLTGRGLLYVDPRPGAPQPARAFGRSVDILIDEPSAVRVEVERRLAALEALAQQNGSALGLASDPAPSVVAAIAAWSAGIEARGVVIAPISVLIRRPAEQASR